MAAPVPGLQSQTDPASDAVAVTASDTVDLARPTRGIYVGVTGDVKVDMPSGSVTFKSLAAGVLHPIRTSRVYSTGTTATNMLAIY